MKKFAENKTQAFKDYRKSKSGDTMANDIGNRMRNISNGARWAIAAVGAMILLGLTFVCSMAGLLMMTFATDACSGLPDWMGTYLIFPPAMMAIGSLVAPLLFRLMQRWYFILGSFEVFYSLSVLLYISWLPIISTQC